MNTQKNNFDKLQKLANLFDEAGYHNDLADFLTVENIDTFRDYDSLTDYLNEVNFYNVDIIYYTKAMEYLTENDVSLSYGLELAHEYGMQWEHLNSEVLASLVATEKQRQIDVDTLEVDNILNS